MQLITKDFERHAIAFPSRVEEALAEIQTVGQAKDMLDKAAVMSGYAKRLKAGIDVEKPIAAGVLKIKAKIGELLPRDKGGRGNKLLYPVQEFSERTIAAYRKIADHKEKLDEYIATCDDVPSQSDFIKHATGKHHNGAAHVSNASGENEWYTPAEYIQKASSVMGGIDLDPASSKAAQRVVQAKTYYTIKDDGLSKRWFGRLWMNPPYAKDLIGQFAEKLVGHIEASDVKQAIVLVNNATETTWFQSMAAIAVAICFPAGRIQFVGKNGVLGSPLQGQAFLYFGTRGRKFENVFSSLGLVVTASH